MHWILVAVMLICLAVSTQTPLKEGMELRYEGKARVQGRHGDVTAKVQVKDLVTEVTEDGKATVASLRVFVLRVPPEAALRFINIDTSGKEIPSPFEKIFAESPPVEPQFLRFSLRFFQVLPIYFIQSERLTDGSAWTEKEMLSVKPSIESEVLYQVKGKEKVGSKECWVVTRTLPKPVPITQREKVSKIADTLWVDAKTGLMLRVQREFVLQIREGQRDVSTLGLELKSVTTLDKVKLAQRLKELQAVKAVQKKLGLPIIDQPTKEALNEAEKAIADFQQSFKDSPYNAYMESWKGFVQTILREFQRQEFQKALIGQIAPDFELPSLDGEKVKLSGLRGKVVLLNFFSHW